MTMALRIYASSLLELTMLQALRRINVVHPSADTNELLKGYDETTLLFSPNEGNDPPGDCEEWGTLLDSFDLPLGMLQVDDLTRLLLMLHIEKYRGVWFLAHVREVLITG